MPKKNPIKKRKQGSQKPNPIPVGKPEKYMGDNEWEQYNEPQNPKKDMVNPEGLSGVTIGESVEMVSSPIYGTQAPVHINPSTRLAQAILGSSEFEDLSGVVDAQNLYLWASEEVKHNDVVDQLGLSPKAVVPFVYIHARASDPHKSVVVSSWNMAHRDDDLVNRVFKTNPNYRKVFGKAPVDTGEVQDKMAKYVGQKKGPSFGISEQVDEILEGELGPLGGFMAPFRGGDSKFAIPDNTAIIDPESFEFSTLDQNKKDAKRVRKTVNRNIKKQKSSPNFEKELTESNVEYLKGLGDQMQEVLIGVLRAVEWSADKAKSNSLRAVKVREWLKDEKARQRVINDWVKDGAPLPQLEGIEGYQSQGEQFMQWLRSYLHDSDEERVRQEQAKDSGNWGEYVNQYMAEMIRLPIFSLISGEYEVKNEERTVGYARVKDGVVEELTCASGVEEDYRGEVLTHLLNTIIGEADMQNSNLSLQLQNKDDDDMKRFLERFGFRHVGHGVMQRTAGAVRPPSVQYTSGQEGP